MTLPALCAALLSVCALVRLRRFATPRYCAPTDHLVTVVGARRLRDGLSKRHWIRCRFCELNHGPYDDWQAAWLAALGAQIATRRRYSTRSPGR